MRKKRKLRELTDADIAACEPEAIWLETRKVPLPAHAVLWTVVCLLLTGIIWSCVAKVDKVVAAEGKLVTTRPDIILKPLERSVVKQVEVKVGQIVEEGQTLVSFDPTVNEAERRMLQTQLNAYRGQLLRLTAEQEGNKHPTPPNDLKDTEEWHWQQLLLETRSQFYAEKIAWHNENCARYAAMVKSIQSSLEKYGELMQPMQRIEKSYTDLAAKGITAQVSAYQVQMQRISNEIEIERQKTALVENQEMERAAKAEKAVFEKEWQQNIAAELAETHLKIDEISQKLQEVNHLAAQESLKAPCKAVVHEIAPYQEGSGVREAEAFITLIPLDTPLEAQIDISTQDVGLLRKGDKARLKLDAFPFQQHGTLNGTITHISANTYESTANAAETPTPEGGNNPRPQYRANLSVSGELRHIPAQLWQVSGMRLRAEIKVGEQRVISYLLNPFLKAMDEAIREP